MDSEDAWVNHGIPRSSPCWSTAWAWACWPTCCRSSRARAATGARPAWRRPRVDEDRVADVDPIEDLQRVRDRHPHAAVAGRVVGHVHVAVDGVAADEVVRVRPSPWRSCPASCCRSELAEDGGRGRRARRGVVDAIRVAALGQHEHLARPVELHVLAPYRPSDTEPKAPWPRNSRGRRRWSRIRSRPISFVFRKAMHGPRGGVVVVAGDGRGEAAASASARWRSSTCAPRAPVPAFQLTTCDRAVLGAEGQPVAGWRRA